MTPREHEEGDHGAYAAWSTCIRSVVPGEGYLIAITDPQGAVPPSFILPRATSTFVLGTDSPSSYVVTRRFFAIHHWSLRRRAIRQGRGLIQLRRTSSTSPPTARTSP